MFENDELIHRYTVPTSSAMACSLSVTAQEAGFKYPVALTAAAWARCVAAPAGDAC
jgi:hypothetical protein